MQQANFVPEMNGPLRRMQATLFAALTSLAMLTAVAGDVTAAGSAPVAQPLVIGQTFTLDSAVLRETRRINVYLPPGFSADSTQPLPVLYMPDGGMAEDFLHVAGLIQIGVSNGTMRPWLLVGIENTQRRRDLTGPTDNAADRKIAPQVGGSQRFREFLRRELMPEIRRRYRSNDDSAIVGESLAGLFVMETLALEPDLFRVYIAIDPSLWWNNSAWLQKTGGLFASSRYAGKALFLGWSSDAEPGTDAWAQQMQSTLKQFNPATLRFQFQAYPQEKHATIYHPAALQAFRAMLNEAP